LREDNATTIAYDGDGNRVSETVGGTTTKYLVDTLNPTGLSQVLDEIVSGAVTRTYAYGLTRISENQLVSGTWKPSFYGYDGHGNVRLLTNTAGAVSDSYDYDAFGMPIRTSGATANNFRYSGEWFDSNLGLYHLRARHYNHATGRFWARDPEEGVPCTPLTFNPYIYATDDPVDSVDPTGRQAIIEYLLLIHFVQPVQINIPRCFAQLKYRHAFLRCNHSFWWIQTEDGKHYTISGGPDKGGGQTTIRNSYLNRWVTQGDANGHFPEDNSGDATAYESGTSYIVCPKVQALKDAAEVFFSSWRDLGVLWAIGVAGLVAFSRRYEQPNSKARAQANLRVPGDRTIDLVNKTAEFLIFAVSLGAYFWWISWLRAKGVLANHGIWHRAVIAALVVLIITTLHELGHTATGLALGMRLRAFVAGPFQWRISDGKWEFQFKPSEILSVEGATGVVPSTADLPRWRYLCMLTGGPFATLLTGILALRIALVAEGDLPVQTHARFRRRPDAAE